MYVQSTRTKQKGIINYKSTKIYLQKHLFGNRDKGEKRVYHRITIPITRKALLAEGP